MRQLLAILLPTIADTLCSWADLPWGSRMARARDAKSRPVAMDSSYPLHRWKLDLIIRFMTAAGYGEASTDFVRALRLKDTFIEEKEGKKEKRKKDWIPDGTVWSKYRGAGPRYKTPDMHALAASEVTRLLCETLPILFGLPPFNWRATSSFEKPGVLGGDLSGGSFFDFCRQTAKSVRVVGGTRSLDLLGRLNACVVEMLMPDGKKLSSDFDLVIDPYPAASNVQTIPEAGVKFPGGHPSNSASRGEAFAFKFGDEMAVKLVGSMPADSEVHLIFVKKPDSEKNDANFVWDDDWERTVMVLHKIISTDEAKNNAITLVQRQRVAPLPGTFEVYAIAATTDQAKRQFELHFSGPATGLEAEARHLTAMAWLRDSKQLEKEGIAILSKSYSIRA